VARRKSKSSCKPNSNHQWGRGLTVLVFPAISGHCCSSPRVFRTLGKPQVVLGIDPDCRQRSERAFFTAPTILRSHIPLMMWNHPVVSQESFAFRPFLAESLMLEFPRVGQMCSETSAR
jgi:hypothetical protein